MYAIGCEAKEIASYLHVLEIPDKFFASYLFNSVSDFA
jgi:hypothetical protein